MNKLFTYLYWKFFNPYKVNMPQGVCPVQIEGTLPDGEEYYFRARHNKWSLEIKNDKFTGGKFYYLQWYGETRFAAGYMSEIEAIRFATKAIRVYYNQLNDIDIENGSFDNL